MNIQKTYNYSDLEITPSILTDITSRSECYPKYGLASLPLFAAPMDSIISIDNVEYWNDNGIIPILPRNIPYDIRKEYLYTRNYWVALSLQEFKELFSSISLEDFANENRENKTFRVCIDIANGHQKNLLNCIKDAKILASKENYNLIIMAGNIANPNTYMEYCKAGVNYVRCGIGGGSGCTTSSNTGVHYGLASLISECKEIKENFKRYNAFQTKIIADGGIKGYRDAIIALACGADYVMIGGIFASFLESAAPISNAKYFENGDIQINDAIITKGYLEFEKNKKRLIKEYHLTKEFHGMSTKEAQLAINPNSSLKTSEGCSFTIPVKYTLKQWANNFQDYLKSAMSYTNCRTLEEFKSNVKFNLVSEGTRDRVNK